MLFILFLHLLALFPMEHEGADVCPFSKNAVKNGAKTPIEFFYKDRTPYLTLDLINGMTEEEFKNRAYAWRGKAVVERNLSLLQNDKRKR